MHRLYRLSGLSLLLVALCVSCDDADTDPVTDVTLDAAPDCGDLAQVVCDGACVDLADDDNHCGTCGNACEGEALCRDGACVLECLATETGCDEVCVNLDVDPANCGACGTTCDDGDVCVDGTCALDCLDTETECADVCVDLMTDDANCGACENTCDVDGQSCVEGSCVCPDGETACGSAGCLDTTADLFNCGTCSNACVVPQNGEATCESGTCGFTCVDGFADCDMSRATGCEVELATDPAHCGACGNACDPMQTCTTGVCG